MWLVSIERPFQGLSGAIETVGIVQELIEIWPNEVCDTNQGLFKPTVMFFGIYNNPVTFQMIINTIFSLLITKNLILVYMDDILIHAPTKKQLHKTMKEVLKILQEHDLYLKSKKCQFAKQWLSYLRYIISPDQVQMNLIKLKGISD